MAKGFRELVGAKPSTASTDDSVLVIIDAQNEYADGALATKGVASTRKAISSLLEKYRKAGGDIIHIVHQVPEGAPVFTPNTDLAKEFKELEPKEGEKVIGKKQPGSFTDTTLHQELESIGKKKLVLTGYMAHVCVSTTAREGSQSGYEIILAEDAIGDRDIPGASGEDVTKMVMLELGDAFGTVVKGSEINSFAT
ncbi:MAG: hypothetical protein M1835_004749 [Candelina submexicana]|nr:MAG: hypothetical protein M1835_004749 [Candelina submexicana]